MAGWAFRCCAVPCVTGEIGGREPFEGRGEGPVMREQADGAERRARARPAARSSSPPRRHEGEPSRARKRSSPALVVVELGLSSVTESCGLKPSRAGLPGCARTGGWCQVASGAPSGEGEPVALVLGPAQRARAARGEAPGERRRRADLSCCASARLGPLAPPADTRVAVGDATQPAPSEISTFGPSRCLLVVFAAVPGEPRVQRRPPA